MFDDGMGALHGQSLAICVETHGHPGAGGEHGRDELIGRHTAPQASDRHGLIGQQPVFTAPALQLSSAARRVGTERVSTVRSRESQYPATQNTKTPTPLHYQPKPNHTT